MYNTYLLTGFLVVLAGLLIHCRPLAQTTEGFAVTSVNTKLMPECVARSASAQSLLARVADYPESNEAAAELRLLVSKLCCMEADIASPYAGRYRTVNLQFRTSEDMEPPATIVGRCLRNALAKRDVELIIEKFRGRAYTLIAALCTGDRKEANAELDDIVARLNFAMTSFCFQKQPSMDRPIGARDMGFWEPEEVSELSQYQGVSAVPK